MAFEQRLVLDQAPNTNIVQDYEVTDFGTPEAAIVFASQTNDVQALEAWSTRSGLQMGFYDGTNQFAVGIAGTEHNTAASGADSQSIFASGNIVRTQHDSTVRRTAVASFLTDKLRLTWAGGTTSHQPRCMAWLMKGMVGVKCGSFNPPDTDQSTEDITGLGINPNLIIFGFGRGLVSAATTPPGAATFGIAVDNGSGIDQAAYGLHIGDRADPSEAAARLAYSVQDNGVGGRMQASGSISQHMEVTAMGSGQFTVKNHGGTNLDLSDCIYMAFEIAEDVELITGASPTSSSVTWDPYTGTFLPQCVFMLQTNVTNENAKTNNEAGAASFYVVNDDGDEGSVGHASEDGVTTVSNQTLLSAKFNTFDDDTTAAITADSPTFDSTGLSFDAADITGSDGSARRFIGFAIGGAASQVVTITLKDLTGSTLRTNLSSLKWAWYDSMPTDTSASVDEGTAETTDGSGVLVLDLPNTTLTTGQFGYLSLEDTGNNYMEFYRLAID